MGTDMRVGHEWVRIIEERIARSKQRESRQKTHITESCQRPGAMGFQLAAMAFVVPQESEWREPDRKEYYVFTWGQVA